MKSPFKHLLILLLLQILGSPASGARKSDIAQLPVLPEASYIYLAPNVIQNATAGIFTSFAVTNTTSYWFNFKVYLVDRDGEIVHELAPLIKGQGTWQHTSADFLLEDFQGSIWIISSNPLVGVSMNYQLRDGGELEHLASVGLEPVSENAGSPDSPAE